MDEIRKNIIESYNLVSAVAVSGDAVDLIAATRAKLKRAIRLIDEEAKLDGGQQNPGSSGD